MVVANDIPAFNKSDAQESKRPDFKPNLLERYFNNLESPNPNFFKRPSRLAFLEKSATCFWKSE